MGTTHKLKTDGVTDSEIDRCADRQSVRQTGMQTDRFRPWLHR